MKFTAMAGDLDTAGKVNRRVVGQRDVINTSGRFTDVDAGSGRPPRRRDDVCAGACGHDATAWEALYISMLRVMRTI